MSNGLLSTIFGTKHERDLKGLMPILHAVNARETWALSLKAEDFPKYTDALKKRLREGETLDDMLPEAFALVREASRRTLGERPYDVQIMGAIVLHQGKITEMKTGEGKTLASISAAYLNSLEGLGVHIVTVNDYLAERDASWMKPIYDFLGVSVGSILSNMDPEQRQDEYAKDITYGTNNEFGFDYLRDNMKWDNSRKAQKHHHYAIIDEIDSILVDEARTPLIISGPVEEDVTKYILSDKLVRKLKECEKDPDTGDYPPDDPISGTQAVGDYKIEEKSKRVMFTNEGMNSIEKILQKEGLIRDGSLFDEENFEYIHYFTQALKARRLFGRDKDYVVQEGQVQIVDEFTGRILHGRRYSDGLHQAIEAKESMRPARKSRTLATITFQNYFRMYDKLSGMTGTADTEAREFGKIYHLDVVVIPTNRPVNRVDDDDIIFLNEDYKFNAICDEIAEVNKKGQPVLVGTVSVEKSEKLAEYLNKRGVSYEILNAKNHHREALIIAEAGAKGSVTIATNMAGRGTDIKLGGNPDFTARNKIKSKFPEEIAMRADGYDETDDEEVLKARELYREIKKKDEDEMLEENKKVLEAGGLCIIGTERHESRRIDNQLRGRSGRQGDPGSSKFYISIDDDLMRLFAGDKIKVLVDTLKLPEDEPLQHNMLSKSIETAQARVEGRNFNIRKHVLQYDNVMNKQREIIYSERRKVLMGENLKEHIMTMVSDQISLGMDEFNADKYPENWDIQGYEGYLSEMYGANIKLKIEDVESLTSEKMNELSMTLAQRLYSAKEKEFGEERFREVERIVLLKSVDTKWMDHIDAMDQLRQGVALRAMGNEDPVRAYQNEGFDMFQELIAMIQEDTVKFLYRVRTQEKMERQKVAKETGTNLNGNETKSKTVVKGKKIGRNDPCPCGSGKKYKKCCGKDA